MAQAEPLKRQFNIEEIDDPELVAIKIMSELLGELPNASSRARVLNFVEDRMNAIPRDNP